MVHPIEEKSYRILDELIDLSNFTPLQRAVIARVIHASADLDYATEMVLSDLSVQNGIQAIKSNCAIITDVEMVRVGISNMEAKCYLSKATSPPPGITRSAAGIQLAAQEFPIGALVVIGNAPTAVFEVIRLIEEGLFNPCLVIGMPVGFVGAAESKQALRQCEIASITNTSSKGGSGVAAAAVNAIVRLAKKETVVET